MNLTRREFVTRSVSAAGASAVAVSAPLMLSAGESPSERIRIGSIGCSRNSRGGDGRGSILAKTFASLSNVEVAWICDVDSRNVPAATESVLKNQKRKPQGTDDYRKVLDDPDVDAVVIATPDHWHAPIAIAACAAGKHVYVEKPCCHNNQEGVWLVEAAKKHDRLVQHGTQRRSWPAVQEAVEKLHDGIIGDVIAARCWYFNDRKSIGVGKKTSAPDWLNWPMWQGPARRTGCQDNLLHYNWHWFWDYGTGEVGNNGVHFIDICRQGLGVGLPLEVTSGGGRYRYDDDQQTPDTNVVHMQFADDKCITFESRSWGGRRPYDAQYDYGFFGTQGSLFVGGTYYKAIGPDGKKVLSERRADGGDLDHLQNFIDSIRGNAKLNAPISEGFQSAMVCNLANISYRTGSKVTFDPQGMAIVENQAAEKLWGRDYEEGFKPAF